MISQWKLALFSIFLFFSTFTTVHAMNPANEWVIDPGIILSSQLNQELTQMLRETALKRGIYVRVFVVNTLPNSTYDEQVEEIIKIWEAKNPFTLTHAKTGYLVINAKIGKALFALGPKVRRHISLVDGLANLEEFALIPALAEKNYDRAAWEGALGLTTALEDWPVPVPKSLWDKFCSLYFSSITFYCFIWSIIFSIIGIGIAWYLRDPKPREMVTP